MAEIIHLSDRRPRSCIGPPCWCALAERAKGDCDRALEEVGYPFNRLLTGMREKELQDEH